MRRNRDRRSSTEIIHLAATARRRLPPQQGDVPVHGTPGASLVQGAGAVARAKATARASGEVSSRVGKAANPLDPRMEAARVLVALQHLVKGGRRVGDEGGNPNDKLLPSCIAYECVCVFAAEGGLD